MRKMWSEEEVLYLVDAYPVAGINDICGHLGRTWSSIEHKALRLGLVRRDDYWSDHDVAKLHDIYSVKSRAEIELELHPRSWSSITNKAKLLGLKSNRRVRKGDARVLMSGTPEALYWIGFLLADGHVSSASRVGDYSIEVALSAKDEKHLAKLGMFTSVKITDVADNKCRFRIFDRDVVIWLQDTFGFSNRKTYNPPSPSLVTPDDDDFYALFIGFFDGDGHRRADRRGRLQIHSNWIEIMKSWCQRLARDQIMTNDPYINNGGYCDWHLNLKAMEALTIKGIQLDVPMMERKWASAL